MSRPVETWSQVYRLILGLLLVGFLYIIWPYISSVVVMLVFAFLLTTILLPSVDYLEKKIKSRLLGVILITLVLTGGIGLFIGSFISQLIQQAREFSGRLTQKNLTQEFQALADKGGEMFKGLNIDLNQSLAGMINKISGSVNTILDKFLSLAGSLGGFLFTAIMVLIFTIIIMNSYHRFKRTMVGFIPNRYFEIGLRLTSNIERQVSNYLRGQLLAATSVAIMSIIGLFILNFFGARLTLVIFIGIIAGFANLIPMVGPFVGMIPAILIAIMNNLGNEAALMHKLFMVIPSPFYILDIVLMFLIVQQIDNNLITPMLVGESVGLHPLMVMIALLIGGTLVGPLGMLFAVPAAGVLKVIIQEISFVTKNAHLL